MITIDETEREVGPVVSEDLEGVRIYTADCRDAMRSMEPESIDTIITDPPYGLGFMGKEWDTFDPSFVAEKVEKKKSHLEGREIKRPANEAGRYDRTRNANFGFQTAMTEFFAEALRVAKPGAMLFAFGGTRTFHRLACAIEDAGWEIRDTMGWLHSQGFPKSHNFGCKCDGESLPYNHDSKLRDLPEESEPSTESHSTSEGSFLLKEMHGGSTRATMGEVWPLGEQGKKDDSKLQGREQSGMEGRRHFQAVKGQLYGSSIRSMSVRFFGHGSKRWLRHGASFDNGQEPGKNPSEGRGRASYRPQSSEQQDRKSDAFRQQFGAQESGTETCQKCGRPKAFRSHGTALKPAWEPICVAMKPLDGTYAENALKHGVAGLNIDAARIEGSVQSVPQPSGGTGSTYGFENGPGRSGAMSEPSSLGRWPANILHDGSEEATSIFPDAPGQQGEMTGREPSSLTNEIYGQFGGRPASLPRGDFGSSARFFYCAKASTEERNEGLEGLEGQTTSDGRNVPADNAYQRGKSVRKNHHPTVKPLSLMRYLVRLAKMPQRPGYRQKILDLFAGSGTTGVACVWEDVDAVLIEKSPEHVELIRGRCAHAIKTKALQPELFTERDIGDTPAVEDINQGELF